MIDQSARTRAATDLDTTLFVEAAAGTGKTTALVARILHAVTTGRARLYEIVAITFTEKAAGELKVRLREEIEKQLRGDQLRQALSDLERANITTIHSFCASILRERPVEAKVDPKFAVADDLQRQLILDEAWTQWLEAELAHNPGALRQALLREVALEQVQELAYLLVDYRAQLSTHSWPALTHLSLAGVRQRLSVAAPDLERSLKHFTAGPGNFAQQAQSFLQALPQLEHASEERAIAVLSALELVEPKRKADFDSDEVFANAKKAVKELKAILNEFAIAAEHNFLVSLVTWLRGFCSHFQNCKHAKAMLDFDDLLEKTRDLLRDDTEVRRQLQQRYKFILVDEFQDTDPVQSEIVLTLGKGTPGKLFIVGDPKQSIYGFRRADIEMYANTRGALADKGATLVFQQNFRSRSTILDWVNSVFVKLIMPPTDGLYQPDYIALAPSPKLIVTEPRVTLLRPALIPEKQSVGETRKIEAAAIACYLRQQVAAGICQWRDVALLFRSFTGVEVFADALLEHGVPYRVIGGRGYYQRQEIQTLISLLCCLDNPNDRLNLVAVLRSPLFGWSDEQVFLTAEAGGLSYLRSVGDGEPAAVRATFKALHELHKQRHDFSVAGFVEQVFARTHLCQALFTSGADGASRVANLLKALELARRLEMAGVLSLRAFVRQLRATVIGGVDEEPAPANEESDDVVRLLTMHKSKGLEFPVVVLADLAGKSSDSGARLVSNHSGKTFEIRFGGCRTLEFDLAVSEQDKRDEAEEIRLLYVAATRAKERLIIPWFAVKGERLDLLRRGFEPVASALVECPELQTSSTPIVVPEISPGDESIMTRIATRQRWLTERGTLLDRAAQPRSNVTPSGLAHEQEPSENDRDMESIVRERAMEFGIVVHTALELRDTGTIAASGLSEADKKRAVEMVERALQTPLLARAAKADEVHRELSFTFGTEAGLMDGKIDLLFREVDRWTLVDYKTDAKPDAERYRAQMRAYMAALQHVAGIEVKEAILLFLATGAIVKVS